MYLTWSTKKGRPTNNENQEQWKTSFRVPPTSWNAYGLPRRILRMSESTQWTGLRARQDFWATRYCGRLTAGRRVQSPRPTSDLYRTLRHSSTSTSNGAHTRLGSTTGKWHVSPSNACNRRGC